MFKQKTKLKKYIRDMNLALDDEIDALKKGYGSKIITLIEGELTSKNAEKYLYQFIIDTEFINVEDSPGQLIIPYGNNENKNVQVKVISVSTNEIILSAEEDLGNYIPKASLNIAPYYLLEILKERLEEVNKGEVENFNTNLSIKLFDGVKELESYTNYRCNNKKLNEEQKAALNCSQQQDITFIWGPPGTGKTYTIGNIISEYLKNNKTVLLTSHTNAAVDTALLKLEEDIYEKNIIEEGKIIRYGTPQLKDTRLKKMILENIVEDKSKSLRDEKIDLEKVLEGRRKNLKRINELLKLHKNNNSIKGKIKIKKEEIKELEDVISNYENEQKLQKDNIEKLKNKIKEIENSIFIKKIFSTNPDKLRDKINENKKSLKNIKQLKNEDKNKLNKINNDLDNINNEFKKIKKKIRYKKLEISGSKINYKNLKNESNIKKEKHTLEKRIEEGESDIEKIKNKISQIKNKVLKDSKVIGTTLSKTYLDKIIYNKSFDAVIIDESSMASLPNVFFACGKAKKNIVISGDFRQLSPIAVADTEAANNWLKKDIFKKAGIIEEINDNNLSERLVMLKKQYRMVPKITDIVNKPFYKGKLITSKKVKVINYNQPFENDITFCDTSVIDPWCANPRNSYSKYNLYSAILSLKIAVKAINNGFAEVGIIAPYSAHTHLLNKLINDKGYTNKIQAGTVHKFQGNEKALIIIDTVDGKPNKKIGILMRGNTDAMRLINVAVTRAKQNVVIINNYNHFNKYLSSNDSVKKVMDYCFENGKFIDAMDIMQFYDDERLLHGSGSLSLGELEGDFVIFNENIFYDKFINELTKTKNRVVIISPYIAPKRLATVIDTLRYLVDNDKKVIILTRPSYQNAVKKEEVKKIINNLKDYGMKVFTKRNLHEKFAFIDDEICWFGSLNILSHSNTTEKMFYVKSQSLVKKMIDFFQIDLLIKRECKKKKTNKLQQKIKKELLHRLGKRRCPRCNREMDIRFGKYGPFFGCVGYAKNECKKTINIKSSDVSNAIQSLHIDCPKSNCNGQMVYRRSKNGAFLGCSNYPDCKTIISLK